MLYSAKNGTLPIENTHMDYIRFGSGPKNLILLPGLGDGLRTVRGTALPMAAMYRQFTKDFTVYAFSRRNSLPEGFSTRDMARDVKAAMDALSMEKADVLGVSMGGMIAQHLAADYPERIGRLVLTVTCHRPNPVLTASVSEWIALAQAGNHTAFMDSNVGNIYSHRYYRKNKWLIPLMGRLTKPASYDRFFCQAKACLTHDAADRLSSISAPTLIIAGQQDRVLGWEASREMAARIPGACLKVYPQWGHSVYEEEPDFNRLVLTFLTEKE